MTTSSAGAPTRSWRRLGVRVEVAWRAEPQRRAFVHVDSAGERTITVIGDRLGPHGADPLPWEELEGIDAVYFTAGDAEAARAARAGAHAGGHARAAWSVAGEAGVQLDALVSSAKDAGERYEPGDLDPPPRLVARTAGRGGGIVRDERRAARAAGRPRRCPARWSTPTERATASRRA